MFPGTNPGHPFPSLGMIAKPRSMARRLALTFKSGPRILSTGQTGVWFQQTPQYFVEGETAGFVAVFNGATACSNVADALYLDSTDVSSGSLSGTASAIANAVKTRLLTSLVGSSRYVMVVRARTDSTWDEYHKVLVIVSDPSEETGGGWAIAGPQWAIESEVLPYTFTLQGASVISGTPTVKAYKDGTDVTSTNFPSGSCSASGTTITLPSFTAITAGRYVIALTASVDGRTEIHRLLVYAQNQEDEL